MQAENEEEDAVSVEEYVARSSFTRNDNDQVRYRHGRLEDNRSRFALTAFNLFAPQLSFSSGDVLLVHAKTSSEWWWAELSGVKGYVPASYLLQGAEEEEEEEDPWQHKEYFGSYGTLVRSC